MAKLIDQLAEFESLPDSAHVRPAIVCALLGCTSTTIWRMTVDGRMPKPKKISEKVTGFHVGELRAFMDRFKPVTGKYDSAEKKKKAK